jgi:hypothetical protein
MMPPLRLAQDAALRPWLGGRAIALLKGPQDA